jgi:hypothetical protein
MTRLSRLAGGSAVAALLSIGAIAGPAAAQSGQAASQDTCNILFSRAAAGTKAAQIAALDRFLGACPHDARAPGARARRARLTSPSTPIPAPHVTPRPHHTPAPQPVYIPAPIGPAPTSTSPYMSSQDVVEMFKHYVVCGGFRASDYSCSTAMWAITLDSTVINYTDQSAWYIDPEVRADWRAYYSVAFDPVSEDVADFRSYSVSSRGVCDATAPRYWMQTTAKFFGGNGETLDLAGDALTKYRELRGTNRPPITDHPCVRFIRSAGTPYDTLWKSSADGGDTYTLLPIDGKFIKYRLWNRRTITLRDP